VLSERVGREATAALELPVVDEPRVERVPSFDAPHLALELERGQCQQGFPVDGRHGDLQLAGEPQGLVEHGFEGEGLRVFHGRTAHFTRPVRRVKSGLQPDSLRPVRVAIDARALLNERTGIGTYTMAIARGLAARGGVDLGLFAPRPFPKSLDGTVPGSVHTDHHPAGIVWL